MRPLIILKTGTTVPRLVPRRGDFEDWFRTGLGLTADHARVVEVQHGDPLPDPASISAVIITGSSAMVTEEAAWSVAIERWIGDLARADTTPILGVCYGHQQLARALGGSAGWNPNGREIGTIEVQLTKAGQRDRLFGGTGSTLTVQATHSQSVLELPPDAVHLGHNEADPHQAFAYGQLTWSCQFHPEFDADIVRGYLAERHDQIREEGIDPDQRALDCRDSNVGSTVLQRFATLVREREAGSSR